MSEARSESARPWIVRLRERLADIAVGRSVVESDGEQVDPPRLRVSAARAVDVLRGLRDDEVLALRRLVDLTAVDRSRDGDVRLELVYRLESAHARDRVWLQVDAPSPADDAGAPIVDSVVGLWPAADWLEREVFDLFGIRFRGHPDLRRLLLDADFEGAPLRKDHPLRSERTASEASSA